MCVLSSCVPYRYLLRCGWLNDTGMSPNFPKWRELYQSAVQKVKGCTILVPKLFFNQSMKCNIDQCFQYYYCISRCTNGRTENPCVAGSIPALATKPKRGKARHRAFCFLYRWDSSQRGHFRHRERHHIPRGVVSMNFLC